MEETAHDLRDLTAAMRRGDEAAWRGFHEGYYDFLTRCLLARGIGEADLGELVQKVYLRMLKNLPDFDSMDGLEAWLSCVVRTVVIDHFRAIRRRAGLLERFKDWWEEQVPARVFSESPLEGMPGEARRLLERHYLEGWSQSDLAAEAGVSVKAMENRLARLREKARRHWLAGEGRAS